MNFEVVVAHYHEELSWIAEYRELRFTVYTKGVELPNCGREASTYLFHMINRYDTLADRTLFLQGSPFEHQVMPIVDHQSSRKPFDTTMNAKIPFDDHRWRSDDKLVSSGRKSPLEHMIRKEQMLQFWDKFIQTPVPPVLQYNWGAQFSVTRELVRSLGLDSLREMHEWCQQGNDYYNAVMFEIMWPSIFRSGR